MTSAEKVLGSSLIWRLLIRMNCRKIFRLSRGVIDKIVEISKTKRLAESMPSTSVQNIVFQNKFLELIWWCIKKAKNFYVKCLVFSSRFNKNFAMSTNVINIKFHENQSPVLEGLHAYGRSMTRF
jgi:hypothetical protein